MARLDGRIIAYGSTPDEAARAAQRSRHKERPEISYMAPESPVHLSPLLDEVRTALPNQEIYLVGGAVRDALLGKVSHDLDFAVPEKAVPLARRIASALKADFYVLDDEYDIARVLVSGRESSDASERTRTARDVLDFSSYRKFKIANRQASEATSRRLASIDDDLRGRDFTINAMAYDLRDGTTLDPLHGAADLRARVLRACTPTALEDDPVRILRGVRLAAALDLRIEPATRLAMKKAAGELPRISPERQRDELFKMIEGKRPEAALRALEMLGVFGYLMPEIGRLKGVGQSPPHVADVWEHTLSVIRYLDQIIDVLSQGQDADKNDELFTGLLNLRLGRYRDRFAAHFAGALNAERSIRGLLLLAALYHDVSKPATKSLDQDGRFRFIGHETAGAEAAVEQARAFNLSNDEIERLRTIIANHMRLHFHVNLRAGEGEEPTRRAIYRFFRDTGEAGVDLVLLGLADLRGTHGHLLTQELWTQALDIARLFLEHYWEKPHEAVAPPRLIDGSDLMSAYGLTPGPVVGALLEAIREAQAVGQISTREQALEFGRAWLTNRESGGTSEQQ